MRKRTPDGEPLARPRRQRRRVLEGAALLALLPCVPASATSARLPAFPALTAYLAGRVPRLERIRLELPPLADNGLAVPMRIVVAGPFARGEHVTELRVFAPANPVPDLAVFEFPQPLPRVELDTRIRLATTQQVVAVAALANGTSYAAAEEVVVTIAGCMDGT
jgi:sulfur-oxidizing protein SoxY